MSTTFAADDAARSTLLEHRARMLAAPRVAPDDAAGADWMEILLFNIDGEQFAIPLASMVAIAPVSSVTPLPRAVAPVYGVTAWRGRPLTVLTLGPVHAIDAAERRLIVLGDGRRAVAGLLVGEVGETRTLSRAALVPPHQGPRRAMALGMTDDAVLVLDADAMLDSARPGS